MQLKWEEKISEGLAPYWEAVLHNFYAGDGVRFSLQFLPTCRRRGQWKLLIEVAGDIEQHWGCFDEQDQPMRYYHVLENAKEEAQAIASVLWHSRCEDKDEY